MSSLFFKKELGYLWRHKQVRQTLVNMLAVVCSTGFGAIISVLLVRYLGADNFGIYTLIISMVSILTAWSGCGLDVTYSQLLLNEKKAKVHKAYMGVGVYLFAFQAVILGLVLSISAAVFWYTGMYKNIAPLLFAVSGIAATSVVTIFLKMSTRDLQQMYIKAFERAVRPLIFILLLFILSQDTLTTQAALYAYYSTFLITTLVYVLYQKPILKLSVLKTYLPNIKNTFSKVGRHIYIARAIDMLSYHLDILMLGFVSPVLVGYYAIGLMLTRPLTLLLETFTMSSIRKFVTHKHIPPRFFLYYIGLWAAYSMILLIIQKYVIQLLWGEAFLVISSFLWILLLSALCTSLYHLLYNYLYAQGVAQPLKRGFYYHGAMNLLGNVLLIPTYGIIGAATATVISNAVFFVVLFRIYKKNRRFGG